MAKDALSGPFDFPSLRTSLGVAQGDSGRQLFIPSSFLLGGLDAHTDKAMVVAAAQSLKYLVSVAIWPHHLGNRRTNCHRSRTNQL